MKSNYAVIALTTAAAFWLTTGCGKKEEAAPTAQETQKAVQQAAGEVQKAAEQPVPAAQQATAAATTPAGSEAQPLIDKAKGLMADKKWVDALSTLKDAAGKQPTTEQKSLLDQLIAEVQKAIASDAGSQLKGETTKKLGGLLGK